MAFRRGEIPGGLAAASGFGIRRDKRVIFSWHARGPAGWRDCLRDPRRGFSVDVMPFLRNDMASRGADIAACRRAMSSHQQDITARCKDMPVSGEGMPFDREDIPSRRKNITFRGKGMSSGREDITFQRKDMLFSVSGIVPDLFFSNVRRNSHNRFNTNRLHAN